MNALLILVVFVSTIVSILFLQESRKLELNRRIYMDYFELITYENLYDNKNKQIVRGGSWYQYYRPFYRGKKNLKQNKEYYKLLSKYNDNFGKLNIYLAIFIFIIIVTSLLNLFGINSFKLF